MEYNKISLEKLLFEMNSLEKYLTECGLNWTKKLKKENSDIIYEFTQINKDHRVITFKRDGNIELSNTNTYNIIYNVLTGTLKVENWPSKTTISKKNNAIEITSETNTEKVSIAHFNNTKKISLIERINRDSSILLDLIEDKEGNIKKCNIDFRTHKGNQKINGTYALRIKGGNYPLSLKSIDRHGYQTMDFSGLLGIDEQTLTEIKNGNITNEIVENIATTTSAVINVMSMKNGRKHIPYKYDSINIESIREKETEIINYLRQIETEIPVQGMKNIIEETTKKYGEKEKKHCKRKQL